MRRHCKKISELSEPIDGDLQVWAAELDCQVSDFRVICNADLTGAIGLENFDRLWDNIVEDNGYTSSFDDNTDLTVYQDMNVILHSNLNTRCIIFDSSCTMKVETLFNSYN